MCCAGTPSSPDARNHSPSSSRACLLHSTGQSHQNRADVASCTPLASHIRTGPIVAESGVPAATMLSQFARGMMTRKVQRRRDAYHRFQEQHAHEFERDVVDNSSNRCCVCPTYAIEAKCSCGLYVCREHLVWLSPAPSSSPSPPHPPSPSPSIVPALLLLTHPAQRAFERTRRAKAKVQQQPRAQSQAPAPVPAPAQAQTQHQSQAQTPAAAAAAATGVPLHRPAAVVVGSC